MHIDALEKSREILQTSANNISSNSKKSEQSHSEKNKWAKLFFKILINGKIF